MKILGLELSSSIGSIAWIDDAADPFSTTFANDRKHSGLFFENLERCLLRFGNPELIVVGLGPGSYAGTRIAIATAIGLEAATGARLLGLPSICAIDSDAETYAVIGDARRQTFFFAEVRDRSCVTDSILLSEAELNDRLQSFDGAVFTTEPLPAFPSATVSRPSAFLLAQLAQRSPQRSLSAPLEPIYLREPHITQAKVPVSLPT